MSPLPDTITLVRAEHYARLYRGSSIALARRYAREKNGVLYTMVDDSDGTGAYYRKGFVQVDSLHDYIVLPRNARYHQHRIETFDWEWDRSVRVES